MAKRFHTGLTLDVKLALTEGGTGASTQAGAANAILPSQTGASGKVLQSNGTDVAWATPSSSGAVDPGLNGCRLALAGSTTTPAPVSEATSASYIHLVPKESDKIALYDGASWVSHTVGTLYYDLSTNNATATKPHDIFCYSNSGTPALEILAWTSTTARATALARQDGVLVKSGDATRRYLGSFYAVSTTLTHDNPDQRFLWNYYHRVRRGMVQVPPTTTASWTYTTATWRQAENVLGNRLEFMIGVEEDYVELEVVGAARNSTAGVLGAVGIGIDTSTTDSSDIRAPGSPSYSTAGQTHTMIAKYRGTIAIGKHEARWLERSVATGTVTWLGVNTDSTYLQCGIYGSIAS